MVVKPLPSTLSQSQLLDALRADGFDGQIAARLGADGAVVVVNRGAGGVMVGLMVVNHLRL